MSADIDPAGLELAGIRCSLHATAEQAADGGHTIVRLRAGERLDRDFILRLALARHDQVATSLVLTPDSGEDAAEGTFTLTLLPPDGADRPRPRDVVLVLDRSGSMDGWKMVAARRAAARIVDTLTAADRFSVLCFDNVVERMPGAGDTLAEATDRNRFRAVEWLARTPARGGTVMLEPLEQAVRLLTDETRGTRPTDRDRVLVLVTDGQVGNEDQIIKRIGARLAGIRVHVVGIDRAVNAGFLGRLAAAGRGRCELVESEDRLDEAAARIHRRIGAPLVTAVTLAADGLQIEPGMVAPSLQPDLFPGVPLTVAGRWRGHPGGAITVGGISADGEPFQSRVAATLGGNPASTAAWARAHLRDLEDRYASLTGYGAGELDRLEQQITAVSLRYGVLCRFTAFVAVDSRVVTDGARPHRVTQPVELPAGWSPTGAGPQTAAMPLAAMRPSAMGAAAMPPPPPMAMRSGRAAPMTGSPAWEAAAMPAPGIPAAPMPTAVPTGPMPTPGRPTGAKRTGAASRRAPQVAESSRLVEARRQMADEAAELRAVYDAPDAERARLLADLATRIDALLAWLAADRTVTGQAGLVDLARKLRACDQLGSPRGGELDALWQEAIRVLTAFAGGADEGPLRQWWKRTR